MIHRAWPVAVATFPSSELAILAVAAADQLANRDLAVVLVGLGLVLVLAFVVYRRIADPILQLSLRMRGAAAGEIVKTGSANSAAEVVALSEDFENLMEKMKAELGAGAAAPQQLQSGTEAGA